MRLLLALLLVAAAAVSSGRGISGSDSRGSPKLSNNIFGDIRIEKRDLAVRRRRSLLSRGGSSPDADSDAAAVAKAASLEAAVASENEAAASAAPDLRNSLAHSSAHWMPVRDALESLQVVES